MVSLSSQTHKRNVYYACSGSSRELSKWQFAQKGLECLGHIVSQKGLKPNPCLVNAVWQPTTVLGTRFLGLCLYSSKFVSHFAEVANHLTCKDTDLVWSAERQQAFERLKGKLISAPVLAYPDIQQDFILETDTSVQGPGAVLCECQTWGKLNAVAYVSRVLNDSEKQYGITELETLADVWGISHFHHFLNGHNVSVYTDHFAVKAVLEAGHPTAKQAWWWTRVYGSGMRSVKILYRAGKENSNADALSRSPQVQVANVTSESVNSLQSTREIKAAGSITRPENNREEEHPCTQPARRLLEEATGVLLSGLSLHS